MSTIGGTPIDKSMIHIATVHHRTARWIHPQLMYLRRTMRDPYRLYAAFQQIDSVYEGEFDVTVPSAGPHVGKLNLLARIMIDHADPEDVLVFLDGDAFPIVDPMPTVREALSRTALVAVRRDENLGDPQPHPSFCATTAGFWQSVGGDWASGYPWKNQAGEQVSDAGGNLLYLLNRAQASWTPLTRSNRTELHPLWFGIYGGIIYHHGAGFRVAMSRRDVAEVRQPRTSGGLSGIVARARSRVNRRQRQRANQRLSEQVYRQLIEDPEFYRQFL